MPASDVTGEDASPTQPFSGGVRRSRTGSTSRTRGAPRRRTAWCRERIAARVGGDLHAAEPSRHASCFRGSWRCELGQLGVRRRSPAALRQHNRLPFVVRLIPREKLAEERAAREGEPARAASWPRSAARPTGCREPLFAPSGLPRNPPPWGTVTAVDLSRETSGGTSLGTWVPGDATGTLNSEGRS